MGKFPLKAILIPVPRSQKGNDTIQKYDVLSMKNKKIFIHTIVFILK